MRQKLYTPEMLVCPRKHSVDKDREERREKHSIRDKEQGELLRSTYRGARPYERHSEAGDVWY